MQGVAGKVDESLERRDERACATGGGFSMPQAAPTSMGYHSCVEEGFNIQQTGIEGDRMSASDVSSVPIVTSTKATPLLRSALARILNPLPLPAVLAEPPPPPPPPHRPPKDPGEQQRRNQKIEFHRLLRGSTRTSRPTIGTRTTTTRR